MENGPSYRRILILTLWATLTGYLGHSEQTPTSEQRGNIPAAAQEMSVLRSTRNTPPDSVPGINPTGDPIFMHTWNLFTQAVKQHDLKLLKKLIVFPLMGAGACYLSHERLQDPKQDTTGITRSQFDSLYLEIFDPHAIERITAPLSDNDPVLVWRSTGPVDSLIAGNSDRGTHIYSFHIEYVQGNREGGKYLLFSRRGGKYKLVALLCDGMLLY